MPFCSSDDCGREREGAGAHFFQFFMFLGAKRDLYKELVSVFVYLQKQLKDVSNVVIR